RTNLSQNGHEPGGIPGIKRDVKCVQVLGFSAWPRPLHSRALRQPNPPLRGTFTHSRFLTDRWRFAPAQRHLSPHPCGSPWNPSIVQRFGMSPQHPRCSRNALSCLTIAANPVGSPFMATDLRIFDKHYAIYGDPTFTGPDAASAWSQLTSNSNWRAVSAWPSPYLVPPNLVRTDAR
ncbi:hypothetical protein SAMN05518863_11486, partial [Candidatus Pantoea symbiotica]